MQPLREAPQAMQPIREAPPPYFEAKEYLEDPDRDEKFGIYEKEEGNYWIGDKKVKIYDNDIKIEDGEIFEGTPGLWELLISKNPRPRHYTDDDYENYERLMLKTNPFHRENDPTRPKSSRSKKWKLLLSPIWLNREEYEGEGVVVIPRDPDALLERLDLLLTSQKVGHTGVRNMQVSICDELKGKAFRIRGLIKN